MKILKIKFPLVLEVVDSDEMNETVSAETHIIIAIPIENIEDSEDDE